MEKNAINKFYLKGVTNMQYDSLNNLKILEESNDISTHIDVYESFISHCSSIGVDLSDGDASEVLYGLTPKDCESENQYKYIVDFLKRFIDIWESKEF